MGRITERSILAANKAIATGLRKHFAASNVLRIDGKRWTVKMLLAALAHEEAQLAARRRARGVWLSTSRSVQQTIKANHKLRVNMRIVIGSTLGPHSAACGDFGFVFRKRGKQTGAARVAAADKRAATRVARGTTGTRQRAKIKGVPPATPSAP